MNWYLFLLFFLANCSNPYQGLHDSLDETLKIIEEFYPQPPSAEKLRQGMLQGLIQSADNNGNYLNEEQIKTLMETIDGGELKLGMILVKHQEGLLVKKVYDESAAHTTGIKQNDILTEFNGTFLKSIPLYNFFDLIKEKKAYKITFLRKNKMLIKEITPGPFTPPSAELKWFKKIACLKFSCISKNAASEVQNHLQKILTNQPLYGLILDLRDCPGGSFEAGIGIASQFLDGHVVVEMQKKEGFSKFCSAGSDILNKLPIVILQNKNTCSAGEIIAASLKAHKRATLVGENTAGKATAKEVIRYLNRKDGLIITIAFLNDPFGKRIGNEGIAPHIKIEESEILKNKQDDVYIEKALSLLLKNPQPKNFG